MLAMALLLGACAGPEAPLSVGIKEIPSDVELGVTARTEPTVAPLPPIALPLNPIGVDDIGPRPRILPPAATACPEADPLRAPAKEAVNTIDAPPAPGVQPFRNHGSFEVTGADAKEGRFPATSVRDVKEVYRMAVPGAVGSWFRFDVEATLGSLTTTTTYALLPEGQDVFGSRPGLYIARVRAEFADGTSEDFRPASFPGLLLLPFPASPGVEWSAAGADPRSGTAMAFTGRVGRKVRVDACGVPLDAWTVRIEGAFGESDGPGVAISPSTQTSFVADYALGTQYGGISLMDAIEIDRTSAQGNVHQENRATIGGEPALRSTDVPLCEGECIVR